MRRVLLTLTTLLIFNISQAGKPNNLTFSSTTDTSVILEWDEWTCQGVDYTLAYRDTNSAVWITINIPFASSINYNLFSLNPSTVYEWKVRCGGNWALGSNFSTLTSCNKSLTQQLQGFDPNPLYAYWDWSYDTLSLTNTSDCDIRIRPEFIISHENLSVNQGDFIIRWFNPFINGWLELPYNINNSGEAIGYWGTSTIDTSGIQLTQNATQSIIIKVRFFPQADYGTYTAIWETNEVDSVGNFLQTLSQEDTTTISLVDCSNFGVDSTHISNITCYNENDGAINITSIQNGSGETLYNWSNGDTTNYIGNLIASTYYCVVTDANWQQCSDSISFTITEPDSLYVIENITNLACNGDSNGICILDIYGGTIPYGQGFSGSSQYNLQAGIYTYTVTDNNGCLLTDTIIISEPPLLTSTISSTNITNCLSANGAIDITVSGGTPAYNYNWDNGSSNEDLLNLNTGTFTCTVTDLNNCTTTNSATINNFTSTISTILSSPTPYNGYNIQCNGDNNGTINSITSGNVGSISYSWSNGQNTSTATNQFSGNHNLIVTDSLGCTATDSITLTEPTEVVSSITGTDLLCFQDNNGTIDLTIVGGIMPYSYAWSGPGGPYNTDDLSGLTAGTYNLTVTDNNGCTSIEIKTLTEPTELVSLINRTNLLCFQDNSGAIDLTVQGGTMAYTYAWTGPGGQYNSEDISGLAAGTYNVTVIDNNGCLLTDTIIISEPPLLTSTISSTNITNCLSADGTIDITVSGGTPAYTYNWDNGSSNEDLLNLNTGTFTCTVTDLNNCTTTSSATINNLISTISTILSSPTPYNGYNIQCNGDNNGTINSITSGNVGSISYSWSNGQNTSTATNQFSGNHNLIVTDSLGCTATDSITLTEPAVLSSNYTQTNVSCFSGSNGSATVNFSGGVTDYLLFWDTLTYPLLNGATTFYTSNIVPSGIYQYTVTDANNCSLTDSITITQPNAPLTLSLATDTICCNGSNTGTINTIINGGTIPYSFLWSNGATTQNLTNVISGTYTLTVTDANNCTQTLAVSIAEYDTLITTYTATDLFCYGDNNACITTNTTGGDSNYNYSWNTGETTPNICNLTAGTYTCTITDGCGCTTSITVTINEPAELSASYTQTNISCFGVNDGGATVNFFGGTIGSNPGDTTYILGWAGTPMPIYLPYPQLVFNTSLLPNPYNQIPAGVYPYTVTDLNGCTIYDTITITQPDSLYTTYSTTNFNGYEISCNGFNDGEIDIQVTGGTSPFNNYLNGTLQGSFNSTNLADGSYTDSIIDANGCTATINIILNEPNELVSTLTSTNISCNGICDGEIISSTIGGVSPYSFVWNTSLSIDSFINGLCTGNYTLDVSDENGCLEDVSTTITEPNPIVFTIDSISDISTYGGSDGAIYITATGGSGLLSYSWTDSFTFTSTNSDIDSLNPSLYSLVISDTNSCIFDTLIELSQPTTLTVLLDSINTISCYDSCDASIFITALGGDSAYTYNWSGPNTFTSTSADILNLCYGEYVLELSDAITTIIDTFNIYQPQPLSSILSADSILCHNGNTQAEINVWGGTQFFTYLWSNGDANYITNLSSGNHSVIVTDQNGCTISNSITLSNPDSILAQSTTTDVSCNGFSDGSATIIVSSGGLNSYSYSNNSGLTYQNSNVFSNLSAGIYSFLISDFNGCLGSANAIINETTQLTSITQSDSVSCYNECDGNIYAIASGGNPPYTYNWGGSSNNLCAGLYNITITDANGCLASNSAIVYEPNPLVINIWINGDTIQASSGFTTYQWYNATNGTLIPGANSESFLPSLMDEFYVVVSDGICEVSSYAIYYNISSINNFKTDFKIYPNPTQGIVTIESNISFESISILNTIGNQLLLVENNDNDKGPIELDLSTFASGIYFIQIEQNNQIMNYRIVLQ